MRRSRGRSPDKREFSTRKLHKRLHTRRTMLILQVELNEKAPTCAAFVEPSDGLEPSTPSLPGVASPTSAVRHPWLP
jgi:hypothetical protein